MGKNKIKIAMVTNHFGITGIGTVIMNYCKVLDKEKYDLTIIAGIPIAEQYERECRQNGIHLVALPSRCENPRKHYWKLLKVLKTEQYDIIHDHGNSSLMAVELTIARLAGITNRIAHSHNSTCPNVKVHRLLNPYFRTVYSKALACGKLAGDWLFGKNNFEILPNGFYTEAFSFSFQNREKIRKKLKIEDRFVMGHIGRMNRQKNQEYLLKVFEKLASKRSDAALVLVGDGPDDEKIKKLVEKNPYKERIILYGETDNPAAFYSAMDVFVFPSRFEGLPVVLLEAQISGLPCVVSDKVTQEVDLGDIIWNSIEADPEQWADAILNIKPRSREERVFYKDQHFIQIQKYDITQSVKKLDKIYTDLMQKHS